MFGADAKIIVGRNEQDNNMIMLFADPNVLLFELADHIGPTTTIYGNATAEVIAAAAQLTARYGSTGDIPEATVKVWRHKDSKVDTMVVPTTKPEGIKPLILGGGVRLHSVKL